MHSPDAALDRFFDQVRFSNPFDSNRVGQSAALAADVALVHQAEFDQLVDLAGRAQRQHQALGALVWGEAGIGKSHLLARLGVWAEGAPRRAYFLYLSNLHAAPQHLPRSVLRTVVSIMTRGRTRHFHRTPLYGLMDAALRSAVRYDPARQYSFQEVQDAFRGQVDELCDQAPGQSGIVDRDAYRALFGFFRSANLAFQGQGGDALAERAVRWLAGDAIEAEDARQLGVPILKGNEDPVTLTDDLQIKNVLVALAQIASFQQVPLILCCDQVDSLEPAQSGALARFLHAVLDSAANLLVITAGLRDTLQRWFTDGVIQESSWHRLTQFEFMLQRISAAQARQIVQKRLEPVQQPFLGHEAIRERVRKDSLFPLGEPWAREFLENKIDVRPRDALNWARAGWRRQQEALESQGEVSWLASWDNHQPMPPPVVLTATEIEQRIDEKVAQKLQEHRQQRLQQPQHLPPDADSLAGLLHALLEKCLNVPQFPSLMDVERGPRPRPGQLPRYDLLLRHRSGADGQELRTALLCLVSSNRRSLGFALRRLAQDGQPPDRLLLIADERVPLDPGAAGQEYLEQIRRRFGQRCRQAILTFEQYVELDALQATLALARSGDLEIEMPDGHVRRVTEGEVVESHHRQERFLAQPLLRLLLAEAPPPTASAAAARSSPSPVHPPSGGPS